MERFKLTAAVYLFLIKDNKILLSRRFNTRWRNGEYSLPAGHLEPNETLVQAMCRESLEEIGIILKPANIELVHTMYRIASSYIDLFFIAKVWEGEIKNMEPDKCDDLRWFSLEALPENIVPSVKQAIDKYKNREIFSEFEIDG
jgi:8-oxo-dGTP diphosphatase